ncbi:23S rRNA (guanosine(2251)-2'-O)-methyltransferase RlmB [Nitrospira sp. Kam-Ns4a]
MGPAAGSGEAPDLLYGLHAVREALRAGTRPLLRLVLAREDRSVAELVRLARAARVPVYVEPRRVLDRLVPHGRHQGVVGVVASKSYAGPADILACARERGEPPCVLILDGVEDPQNLGAVLRAAEAAGAHGVILPERRAVGLTGAVARASAGAVEHLRVARVPNLARLVEDLQAQGLWVYALDPAAEKPYTALDYRGPTALVVGGEGKGVRPGLLEKCDERVRVPMRGRVASLNLSVAAAVVLYEVLRQRST